MDAWYKIVTPRREVREGRSFNPDEFAIALEQVVAGTAPEDYRDPKQFFARTCFTRALRENSGLVLRRLSGRTENTSSVQTLVTQMGGGKTHMLTSLLHLANAGAKASQFVGVSQLLNEAGLPEAPSAKVAVFVGNAWDPQPGRETPWIDIARQLGGDEAVKTLGPAAKEAPPGTDTINRIIGIANRPVLLLFDEVLNLFSRYRGLAEPMHAFLHNIVRCFVGTNHRAAVISLPRSQVEMTDFDLQWQDKIVKVVGAVAKPLLVNDEAEISEVIRRRLFEDLGQDRVQKNVARTYADWCFERRAQLPPEWTAVDTSTTEKKAREFLQSRFEACYPFHPATLSVFQRKWSPLPQFQQTRGTLAMLAQWISWVFRDAHVQARKEALITLGSAPLHVSEFRSVVLGQLGESRLVSAIETDIAGERSHSRVLDADTRGALKDIHRRVGTTILFESSGGQREKVAHLPELRFALGEPELDTTSVDNAAIALEHKAFFVQRVGADGFKIYHKAKIDKAVHDRRASLDDETEIKPVVRTLVDAAFREGTSIPIVCFPEDSTVIQDSPRLGIVVVDPAHEWNGGSTLREQIAEWTTNRGKSARLYPGSLVWCVRKPGRDLREKVEMLLAWRRVQRDVREGVLGPDYERADLREIEVKVKDAEEAAQEEVWASYRFVVLSDSQDPSGLKVIDLGAGHSSGAETLCNRIIGALKAEALLNESVGAGYIDRNWPPAFRESGAWPLASLRQSFLNGALTRLLDPDDVLRRRIVDFVRNGDFGLASGPKPGGTFERLWLREQIGPDEVSFEAGVLLLKRDRAEQLRARPVGTTTPGTTTPTTTTTPGTTPSPTTPAGPPTTEPPTEPVPAHRTVRLYGQVPPELWNRLGTKLLPKLRAAGNLEIHVEFRFETDGRAADALAGEVQQALDDLGIRQAFKTE